MKKSYDCPLISDEQLYNLIDAAGGQTCNVERVMQVIRPYLRTTDQHCKDCCCTRSWKALGITEYTGKSIAEHIEELRKLKPEIVELEKTKEALWFVRTKVISNIETIKHFMVTGEKALEHNMRLLQGNVDDALRELGEMKLRPTTKIEGDKL